MKSLAQALKGTCMLVLLGTSVFGQGISGSLVGTVVDSTDAAVVGADVTLVQRATAVQRKTTTDSQGNFAFSSLMPGEYSLTVVFPGFKSLTKDGINLSAAERLSVGKLVLQVGEVTESITVQARGAVVQTVSSERSGLIASSQVEKLLIRGRNVTSLLGLLPGVVTAADPDGLVRGYNVYVQGNRNNTVNVTVDGMATNDMGGFQTGSLSVSMDAVAEVKVLLTNYQPEYGRVSGANIQLVMKSGTRDFHGLVSYFKRHEQFNANNFFNNRLSLPKPRYRFNTWNYNIGGPVYIPKKFNRNRDKLFFFWSQEFWPMRTPLGVSQLTVPTEKERAGDFSESLDLNNKLIVIRDPTTGAPFPGNLIPASRIDPNGRALLNVFPKPNFLDRTLSAGRYNYVFQTETEKPQYLTSLKVDYNMTPNDQISGTFSRHTDRQTGAMGLPTGSANWPQLRRTFETTGSVLVARYQRIFSPTLINEFTVGYLRRPEEERIPAPELERNVREKVGFRLGQLFPEANPLKLIPNATFGGVVGAANLNLEGRTPLSQDQWVLNVTNNLTKNLGAHMFKVGIYIERARRDMQMPTTFNGSIDFGRNVNNPLDTNYAYANAILGVFNSYSEATGRPYIRVCFQPLEWFAQDSWKVTRRLTLEYGVRFVRIEPMYERDGRVSGFVPARYNPLQQVRLIQPARVGGKRVGIHPITGEVYPDVLIGAIAPGTGDPANGMVVAAVSRDYPRGLTDNPGLQYGPRLGFAWDPFGKGKTAIRGGFGAFYNLQDVQLLRLFGAQPPLVNTPVIRYSALSELLSSPGFLFPQNVLSLDRDGHVPQVMNMSLSVQQHLGFGTVADIGYVGSLGRHLLWQRNLEAIPFGANFDPKNADPTSPGKPLPPAFLRQRIGYENIHLREWASSSNYHSLQVTVNRRFTSGLQFGATWTWSKAMDFNDSDFDEVSTLVPVRVWNYGLASFDRTHVFNLNYLWEVPRAPWKNPLVRRILNGWEVSGITRFVSGAPLGIGFSQVVPTDITGSPTHGARIVVTDNPVLPKSQRTFSRNFRTEVFRLPAVGTIGNAAKTLIRGPGINNWDIAIFKNFPLTERARLQFRSEMYNAFNHTQFSGLDTTARFDPQGNQVNARFGEFTAASPPRQIQLALRLYF